MPTERLSMRRIRDLLRLKFENGLSSRSIAASLGISKGAVGGYLQRAQAAGLSWPLPADVNDTALERLLFPGVRQALAPPRAEPNWAYLDQEMRRTGVTRSLLWQEYRAEHPDGFGYAWFCEHSDAWKKRLSPTKTPDPIAAVGHAPDRPRSRGIGAHDQWNAQADPARLGRPMIGARACRSKCSLRRPELDRLCWGKNMATLRYGVFLVGDLWTVSNATRPLMCFTNRAEAVCAAQRLVRTSRGEGHDLDLHVMDVGGELTRDCSETPPGAVPDPIPSGAIARLERLPSASALPHDFG
jgi:hypothetical protein